MSAWKWPWMPMGPRIETTVANNLWWMRDQRRGEQQPCAACDGGTVQHPDGTLEYCSECDGRGARYKDHRIAAQRQSRRLARERCNGNG